jgi:hypothetical protein
VVGEQLKEDLDWLWDMRCRQHLYELADAEFDFRRCPARATPSGGAAKEKWVSAGIAPPASEAGGHCVVVQLPSRGAF